MGAISPPEYGERIIALGSNGGGKSVLMRELLAAGYPRTVTIDVKGDFEPIQPHRVVTKPDDWLGWRADHIVYRPGREHQTRAAMDGVLNRLYNRAQKSGKRHPFVVYIDEALYLAKLGCASSMAALAVSGRSLGLGLWITSQRPKWIPVEVRSEAWRWYVFYLSFEEDEREVLKHTKGRLTLQNLQEGTEAYSFWEIRRGRSNPGLVDVTHHQPVTPTS
jgi:hypothetical protein